MLILPQKYSIRNKVWEHYTPNEVYNNLDLSRSYLGYDYSDNEALYALKNKFGGQKVWREFRIIQATTGLDVADKHRWWNDPLFMDKVFWVYMKPVKANVDNQTVDFYALEMFESHRVYEATLEKYKRPMFSSEFPGLLIPKECVANCWDETTNGFADNIRERPDEVITQQQVEREGLVEELLAKVKPVEISEIEDSIDNVIPGHGKMV